MLVRTKGEYRCANLMCARGYRLATLHFLAGIFTCLLYSSEAAVPESNLCRLYSAKPGTFIDVETLALCQLSRVERTPSSSFVPGVSLRDHPLCLLYHSLYHVTLSIFRFPSFSLFLSLISPSFLSFSLRFATFIFNEFKSEEECQRKEKKRKW